MKHVVATNRTSSPRCGWWFYCNLFGAALSVASLGGQSARACQVPVFRYALERWEASPYTVAVVHRGPLDAGQQAVAESVRKAVEDPQRPVNFEFKDVDLAAAASADLAVEKEFFARAATNLPRMLLLPPHWSADRITADKPAEIEKAIAAVVWSGPLTAAAATKLIDSPRRRELARRLLAGDSAVWLLMESGDRAQDTAIGKMLDTNLKKLETSIREADAAGAAKADDAATPAMRWSTAVPLRIGFSVLPLDRRDPAEEVFVAMLLAMDPDLKKASGEPIVFPVFGRGRVLGAVGGKRIEAQFLSEACDFITGECSCMVKDSQPGSDLLMAVDWSGLLEGRLVVDKDLPPLTGVMPEASPAATVTAEAREPATGPQRSREGDGQQSTGVMRNVLLTMAVILGVAFLGTFLTRRVC